MMSYSSLLADFDMLERGDAREYIADDGSLSLSPIPLPQLSPVLFALFVRSLVLALLFFLSSFFLSLTLPYW
jgi:hypothetical protein